jgi:hypothetical protein
LDENTDTSTTSTSESDQTQAGAGETGAGADGGAGGTRTVADGGDAFAAERERLNTTIRQLQSDRDRATARLREFEQPTGGDKGDSPENAEILALKAGQAELLTMLRQAQIGPVAEELRSANPVVAELRPDLFDAAQYADTDALKAAVDAEAQRLNPLASAMEERIRAEVLAEVSEKYGLRVAPKTPAGEEKQGDPDAVSLAGMSLKDLDPEQALRVLRSAT